MRAPKKSTSFNNLNISVIPPPDAPFDTDSNHHMMFQEYRNPQWEEALSSPPSPSPGGGFSLSPSPSIPPASMDNVPGFEGLGLEGAPNSSHWSTGLPSSGLLSPPQQYRMPYDGYQSPTPSESGSAWPDQYNFSVEDTFNPQMPSLAPHASDNAHSYVSPSSISINPDEYSGYPSIVIQEAGNGGECLPVGGPGGAHQPSMSMEHQASFSNPFCFLSPNPSEHSSVTTNDAHFSGSSAYGHHMTPAHSFPDLHAIDRDEKPIIPGTSKDDFSDPKRNSEAGRRFWIDHYRNSVGANALLKIFRKRAKDRVATLNGLKASSARRKNPARFRCDLCGNDFTRKHNLENHMKSHYGITDLNCEFCDKAFTTIPVKKRHQESCTNNPSRKGGAAASSSKKGGIPKIDYASGSGH